MCKYWSLIFTAGAVINFASPDVTVDEDNGTVTICLTKSATTSSDVTISVTARELSPVDADCKLQTLPTLNLPTRELAYLPAPSDFIAEEKMIVFPMAAGRVCTSFDIVNDTIGLEGTEDFMVSFNITGGGPASPGIDTATVHIVDDDRK